MTINQLIKQLTQLQDKHGKRTPVVADTQSLRDSINDTWSVIDVSDVAFESVPQVDGDGGLKIRSDGFQSERRCIVLR